MKVRLTIDKQGKQIYRVSVISDSNERVDFFFNEGEFDMTKYYENGHFVKKDKP